MAKILVVEDDLSVSSGIKKWLQLEEHVVEEVANGHDAAQLLKYYKYDLVILDWNLPDKSGIEICREFRREGGSSPVLILTGKGQVAEKREGLDSGADDYLTKPFDPEELSARVRALLRRPFMLHGGAIRIGDLEIDFAGRIVVKAGERLELSPKEFAILELLAKHPNQVFSGQEIFDRVWESQSDTSPEIVRTFIKKLRRKLGDDGNNSVIGNVHGQGYKLTCQNDDGRNS